jgi:hypothetical protein
VTTRTTDRRRILSQPRHRLHCRLRHRRRLRHRLRPVANLSDTAIGPTASSEGPKLQATSRPGGGTSSPPLAPPASAYSHAACSPAPIHRRTVPSPASIHLRATTSPFPQLRTPKLGEQVVPPGRPRRNRLLEGIPPPRSATAVAPPLMCPKPLPTAWRPRWSRRSFLLPSRLQSLHLLENVYWEWQPPNPTN